MDPTIAPEAADMLDRFSTEVATEDQALVESVQRELRSGQVARPHLMASTEGLVVHVDRLVRPHQTASTSARQLRELLERYRHGRQQSRPDTIDPPPQS